MDKNPKASAVDVFKTEFGCGPAHLVSAPGRVNLIGEHTDYNGGYVLPVAIDFATYIAAEPRDDKTIEAIAVDQDKARVRFDLNNPIEYDNAKPWSNYLRGVITEMQKAGYALNGANLVISGNIPQGAGLSSSAAFEIASLLALSKLFGETISGEQAALMGQAAENKFVGCNCGIMDQLVSALGRASKAMLLDCHTLERQYFSIPEDLSILIVNSNVQRGLVDSEYNIRRTQCEAAAKYFGFESLRDLSIDELIASKNNMEPILYKRAHHILSENHRTLSMANALREGDKESINQLMMASHISMRDDFEITVPPIDFLVELIQGQIQGRGGARMTGGGFGGCVVALINNNDIERVTDAILRQYNKETGLDPSLYVCKASEGAFNE